MDPKMLAELRSIAEDPSCEGAELMLVMPLARHMLIIVEQAGEVADRHEEEKAARARDDDAAEAQARRDGEAATRLLAEAVATCRREIPDWHACGCGTPTLWPAEAAQTNHTAEEPRA